MDAVITGERDIKAEYARRRKSRNLATLGLGVLLVAMVVLESAPLDRWVLIGLFAVIVALGLAVGVHIFKLSRCPACERFLGAQSTAYGPTHRLTACPKCKAELV